MTTMLDTDAGLAHALAGAIAELRMAALAVDVTLVLAVLIAVALAASALHGALATRRRRAATGPLVGVSQRAA